MNDCGHTPLFADNQFGRQDRMPCYFCERTALRARVEELRALVEEACEIGMRWAFLLAEAGNFQDRTRLAAIRDEAKGAK